MHNSLAPDMTLRDTKGLEITRTAGGCRLRVRVRPGARSDRLLGVHAGALKLSVVAPPEKGRANEAVVSLLSSALGVARGSIEVVGGRASRDKTLALSGLTPADLLARLEAL